MSVIIACRNAESTLRVQLEALSGQFSGQSNPFSWNVIISDNGSSDGTVALALSFASRLPGLVVVDSSARPGAGYARNIGAESTQAALLVFCDADDEVAPGWLAAMVDALRTESFVAGRFESRKLNATRVLRSRELQQDDGLQESPFGPGLPHAGAGNLGVTRAAFLGVGGFDPEVGCLEDTDLSWRIQLAGVRLTFCPDAVVHVRLRSSLRTMWAQGRSYGAASAQLEHRYPSPTAPPGPTAQPGQPGSRASGPGKLTAIWTLLRRQRSLGGLLWTLGWHVGHREWRPAASGAGSPATAAA